LNVDHSDSAPLLLSRRDGSGAVAAVKNGPALSGYGSEFARDALDRDDTPTGALRRSVM
jgi:hypothetical protein